MRRTGWRRLVWGLFLGFREANEGSLLMRGGGFFLGGSKQFCRLFDIFEGGGDQVAEKVLEALFEMRPDLVGSIEFDGSSLHCLQFLFLSSLN